MKGDQAGGTPAADGPTQPMTKIDASAEPVVGSASSGTPTVHEPPGAKAGTHRGLWITLAVTLGVLATLALAWFVFFFEPLTVVPGVVGMDVARATEEIEGAGFEMDRIDRVVTEDSVATSGTVISQTPVAGTRVDEGTTVTLVVATGARVETEDQVPTESPAEAVAEPEPTDEDEPEPAPAPAPAPAPEPAPAPAPVPEPVPVLTTLLAERGSGEWTSEPFEVQTDTLTYTMVLFGPSTEAVTFRMDADGPGTFLWVVHLTGAEQRLEFDRTVTPGMWQFWIGASDACTWSFKIKEYR